MHPHANHDARARSLEYVGDVVPHGLVVDHYESEVTGARDGTVTVLVFTVPNWRD
ncbi:MAG: hypothetical protein H0X16_09150 [Chloroflexi bacterium]|nr:hypothetical protein [Chloroflexota bacterium]